MQCGRELEISCARRRSREFHGRCAWERRLSCAGRDFGDFVVWRRDDAPAYELAVVVDDAAMQITEVVRGEDLLLSTARQLLLYRALDCLPPRILSLPAVLTIAGQRLGQAARSR